MPKHLVLAGGGHAHMMTLAHLNRFIESGHRVTVIGPSEYHYYSGMGPGMLGETYSPEEIRFATRKVVEKQGGTFLLDKIAGIHPADKNVVLESDAKSHSGFERVSHRLCGSSWLQDHPGSSIQSW